MTDPRNNDPQHDREFDDYLAGRHALSVRYLDASRETAPPELDAAILASARDAVAGAPRRRARSRWRVPLAAAATMVLGVSLVSQLRDDALPEAVRTQADAPLMRQSTAGSAAGEAESVEQRSAEAVADAIAPSAPMPAPALPQAKAVAPLEMQDELAERRSDERNAAAGMQKREADAQRERSARAAVAQAAPPAPAFAPTPASPPSLDEVSIVVRELLSALQSQDVDAVSARASSGLSRESIARSMPVFASSHAARIVQPAAGDPIWSVEILDAAGRNLGYLRLDFATAAWQLDALEPMP
jgi:hypothetical protein